MTRAEREEIKMELIKGEVWCEVHGCIHAETTDPYQYGYATTGEEPECEPANWRKLWIGTVYEEEE